MKWWKQAACQGASIEIFYDQSSVRRAKEFCIACPVRVICLSAARREEIDDKGVPLGRGRRAGVRGGLTATERWELDYPEDCARRRKGDALRMASLRSMMR